MDREYVHYCLYDNILLLLIDIRNLSNLNRECKWLIGKSHLSEVII